MVVTQKPAGEPSLPSCQGVSALSLPTGTLLQLLCPRVLWPHSSNLPGRGECFGMGGGEPGPKGASGPYGPHLGGLGVVSGFSGKTKSWKDSCVFLLRIPSVDRFLGL